MNTNLAIVTSALPTVLIERAAITRAVEIVANVVEKRSTYPLLSNVRLMEDGGDMFVIGTNLDIEIVVAVAAAPDAGFDVTVPADLLKSLLKGAPKAEYVAFTAPPAIERASPANPDRPVMVFDGETVADFDRVTYSLISIHPEAWPAMKSPGHNEARRFSLPGSVLLDAINSVDGAISNEETRYYLNGICVHHQSYGANPGLRFIATDGHRMLGQVVDLPDGANELPNAIWPKQLVLLLKKLMKGKACPDTVSIMVDESKIRVAFDDVTITSKLIEGTFPDVDRVVPRHNDKIVRTSVKAMQEAAAAVALIAASRGGRAVKLEIENGTCALSVLSVDNGTARMAIPVEKGFDSYLEIGFNARYLDEILDVAAMGGDDLVLAFNDCSSPTLITGSKAGWYGVLMPMRV